MNGNHFWFIGVKEWERLQREINNPNPFHYQTFSISIRKAKQLKPVSHFHADGYLPLIKHCLANQANCHGLTQTFDLLANQYGAGHYLKSLEQKSQALITGLRNQQIMLLEESVSYSDYTPLLPTQVKLPSERISTEEFIASQMPDPTNWIEFQIEGAGNESFTLFNSKTRDVIAQGQLDAAGHAYVEIPDQAIFYVDVVFSKTKEYRSWYYTPLDYHGQMLAGSVDAIASSLDILNDIHLAEVVPIAKLYQVLNLSKFFSPNSSEGSKIMPALTENGELIRATSAFITEFYLLDLAGFSYIKPVSQFGQFTKGVAAFGVVNATVTPVMETRIADYLSKDVGLKHAVLDYLSVHPDDSNVEARFKNFLEGLALGALLEPVFIVFRIIKSTLTRTLINRLSTRRIFRLKAEGVKVDAKPVEANGKNRYEYLLDNSLKDGANKQLELYIESLRSGKYKPATAIGAIDSQTGKIVMASNGDVPVKIAPELQIYADKLGGIGVKTSSGNTLGRCAEFRAANELLLSNPNLKIDDIWFTPALRPRTGEIVPRCENCTNIFGVAK
ncbi:hypothetical protein RHO14_04675 [Orbus wheelerorum]|uniref:hypothetical protein n=1 Tax=Orbus wheelerorum TaxID=3074111 RepID=UPI00370DC5C4